jgi:glycosyltransferase involved in cell wall biosynthesis
VKILIIGPYPPPLGGVSVFVKRYQRKLENFGHEVDVLNPCELSGPGYVLELFSASRKPYDLISVNVASFYVLAILFVLGRFRQTQIVDHNWRQLEEWHPLKVRLFSFFVSRCRELILVGAHLRAYYEEHGVALPLDRVQIQNAFIPPDEREEAAILNTYPADVRDFIEARQPLLIANASSIAFYRDVDLYGLDMCVELIARLKQTAPNVGLLFALAETCDEDYYREINRRIDALGIRDNFHFMTGHKELWPLFKKADLMVRPTCSDGYCISIAEAIEFGCAAVASDVCKRARGTAIFANRESEEFLLRCTEALSAVTQTAPEMVEEELALSIAVPDYPALGNSSTHRPLSNDTQYEYSN